MNDTELVDRLEFEYYGQLAANTAAEERGQFVPNPDLPSLREFLHSRGFSYVWLTEHNYIDKNT
jgi:uncharacterized protein (DUF488 family)